MRQYIVDAFTDKVFKGNPAAVCVMDEWLSDETMQNIEWENNLSETAFVVKEGDSYHLRWFTLGGEIDLCGHATMATAYVLTHLIDSSLQEVHFTTLSGELIVYREGDMLSIDFPAYKLNPIPVTNVMEEAFGVRPIEAYKDRDCVCVFENEEQIRNMQINYQKAAELGGIVGVTAPGKEYDCVSRIFCPFGYFEDPVTGSTHCQIVPYWAGRLGKNNLVAYQASRRGGVLHATLKGDRVILKGTAALYSVSDIYIN